MDQNIEITPKEVAALMKGGKVIMLDVRTPQEYDTARIEGCRLVDEALAKEIVETWPKDSPLITVCHHGVRSLSAAVYLRQQGFTQTRSMSGGIDLWSLTVDSSIPQY
jgi:rhodanese-related sulfurtransferase